MQWLKCFDVSVLLDDSLLKALLKSAMLQLVKVIVDDVGVASPCLLWILMIKVGGCLGVHFVTTYFDQGLPYGSLY